MTRRFHVALAVRDLEESIAEYSARLGRQPVAVVAGTYALWRTDEVNLSINQLPERAGELRHLGFEDPAAQDLTSSVDVNGIEWECFTADAQDQEIRREYGEPARPLRR